MGQEARGERNRARIPLAAQDLSVRRDDTPDFVHRVDDEGFIEYSGEIVPNFFSFVCVSYTRMKRKGEPLLDSILIRRCQAGDIDAFAQIFGNYKNLVFHTAFLMLNSAEDAEDILQDVFIQVHRSLNSFDPAKGAFTTWLHRITVNKCLNWRRRWTFFTARLDEISEGDLHVPTISDGRGTDVEVVQQAMSHLSVKLRSVVILRFYWELSYAEMSEVLDLPLGTIKSRLNLALRTLQSILKDEFDLAVHSIKEDSK